MTSRKKMTKSLHNDQEWTLSLLYRKKNQKYKKASFQWFRLEIEKKYR